MNTNTQRNLINLCKAIQGFASANPTINTENLRAAAQEARAALEQDETVIETGVGVWREN